MEVMQDHKNVSAVDWSQYLFQKKGETMMNPAAMDCQRFLFLDLSENSHYQRYQSLVKMSYQTVKRMAGTMKVVAKAEFLEIPRTVRNEKKMMKVSH